MLHSLLLVLQLPETVIFLIVFKKQEEWKESNHYNRYFICSYKLHKLFDFIPVKPINSESMQNWLFLCMFITSNFMVSHRSEYRELQNINT